MAVFFFSVSALHFLLLQPGPVLWHCALHFSALRLFWAVAVPAASHTSLQSCCRFCGYLRCNVATSGPRRVFLHSTNRVSAMVSNSERTWTLSPASSRQQVSKRARPEWAGQAFQPEPQPQPEPEPQPVPVRAAPPCAVPHQNCMHVMPMLRHIRACPSA